VKTVETIYRAKKLNSDEFIEGDSTSSNGCSFIQTDPFTSFQVDPSTIAIHFTNSGMNDSDNKPIFASLSEDGKGGDLMNGITGYMDYDIPSEERNRSFFLYFNSDSLGILCQSLNNGEIARGDDCWFISGKIIGIHKGEE